MVEELVAVVAVVAAVSGLCLEDAMDAASESSRAEVVRGGGFASTTELADAGESGRPEYKYGVPDAFERRAWIAAISSSLKPAA